MIFLLIAVNIANASDPDTLWKIVNDQCVRHKIDSGNPFPCEQVNLKSGSGYAVFKANVGIAQFLLIPTKRISGVEDKELLEKGSPNYWAYAWNVRSDMEKRLQRKLKRDQIALAVNSAYGRTQNQLHIHVDCVRPDVQLYFLHHMSGISSHWTRLNVSFSGHYYWAMIIPSAELGNKNPFKLLADGLPQARKHMDRYTLVLLGKIFADGSKGFILLADHVEEDIGDHASGEELLDHNCAITKR